MVADHEFFEYPYRWAIVALMGMMLIVNGLANNTVIPIATKLTEVYEISDAYVSAPVILSFLVYSLMNFPANHIIDTKGLRFSFLLGSFLFMVGVFLYAMINKGFHFTLIASICVAIGQPFIINCPAKVATFWFFDRNVINLRYSEAFGHSDNDWPAFGGDRGWIHRAYPCGERE